MKRQQGSRPGPDGGKITSAWGGPRTLITEGPGFRTAPTLRIPPEATIPQEKYLTNVIFIVNTFSILSIVSPILEAEGK